MADKITAPRLQAMKQRAEKIVCVTAYDAYFGRLVDEAGADLILVGDSMANAMLGFETTVSIGLPEMVHHTAAVRRGVRRAMLIGDLPFGSYQSSVAQCVDSAVELMRAGAEGVKLEGEYLDEIAALFKAGIPVMGHIGFTPQSVHLFGGAKVQGKGAAGLTLIESAKRIQDAGAFAIVLELIPAKLSSDITAALEIPTIGIGAGICCDGQIQVMHDVLGFSPHTFKHAKQYLAGERVVADALKAYVSEVRASEFPQNENSF